MASSTPSEKFDCLDSAIRLQKEHQMPAKLMNSIKKIR